MRRSGEKLCISNAQDTTIKEMYRRRWYWDKNFTDWPRWLNITLSNYSKKPTVMWGINYIGYSMSTLHKKCGGERKNSRVKSKRVTQGRGYQIDLHTMLQGVKKREGISSYYISLYRIWMYFTSVTLEIYFQTCYCILFIIYCFIYKILK